MTSDPAEAAQSARLGGSAPLWLLATITLTGTLAMHIFVPAQPFTAQDLGTTSGAAQLTLSAYIIGLAVGQLTYGPISDRFGRKPVLLVGMAIYAAASLGAVVAPTIEALIAARFVQAVGACSGLVIGRAIVRDTAAGIDAVRKLSMLNMMIMVGPGLSPVIGAALASLTGWRSIFALLCLLGLANLILIWRLLPDAGAARSQDTRMVLRSYWNLLRSRRFVGYAIGGGSATTSIYAFIGTAPFIFVDQLHRPAQEVGVYLMLNVMGIWFGSMTAGRLVGRVTTARLIVGGSLLSCIGALTFLLFAASGTLGVASTVLPMLLLAYGAGVASPAALAEALAVNPSIAASASGLYGFAQMIVGSACTALSGVGTNPALAVAAVLLGAGMLAQLSFWTASRQRG